MGSVHPKLVLREAKELEAQGKNKEASRKYASLISVLSHRGKHLEAIELCEKALALSPVSTRLHLIKTLSLLELKRHNEAITEIDKFALAALRQERVTQYLELAKEKLGAHLKIQQHFIEKILEVERTRGDLFFALGRVFARQGKNEQALEMVFAGLKTGNEQSEGHNLLKSIINERGRKEDFQYFEKLINKLWPLEKVRKFIMDSSIAAKPSSSKIVNQFLEDGSDLHLKSLDEENAPTLQNLIQELEEALGDRPKGIETISGLVTEFKEKALEVINGDCTALLDLAIAFKEMGLINEARETLLRIGIENEKYLTAQVLLGEIEFESGALVGALDVFQRILRGESVDEFAIKEALYYSAHIYYQLGDLKKAHEYAEKLAELDSRYRNLIDLRHGINQKWKKRAAG